MLTAGLVRIALRLKMSVDVVSPSYVKQCCSTTRHGLSFFHLNAQSCCAKDDALHALFASFDFCFDIIMLTETWYQSDRDVLEISGYSSYFLNRRSRRGGGVLVLAKNFLKCDMVADFTQMSDDFEALTVTCDRNVFAVVYRPPRGNTSAFFSFLDALLGWVNNSGYNVFIGGDVNIDMLNSSPANRELSNLLKTNSCVNTIISPTRIQRSSATLLDVFITNINHDNLHSGVIGADISDHLPIFLIYDKNISDGSSKKASAVTFQDVNPRTLEQFHNKLLQIDWEDVFCLNDPDTAYETFLSIFKKVYTSTFLQKASTTKKSRKPWVTTAALKLIKQKNFLYRRFLKTRDLSDLSAFKAFRNKANKFLKQAKTNYLHDLFNAEVMKRSDIVWRRLNTVLGRGQRRERFQELTINGNAVSGEALANSFNNFFVSLNIATHDPQCMQYIRQRNSQSAFLTPTSREEIHSTFRSFSNSKSCDADNLQIRPIKYVIDIVSPVLEHVFNLVLAHGRFPKRMQTAKVTVIHKGGDRDDLSNYRPISILPIFSKCLEKIINERMSNFCEKHDILIPNQFGFRKGYSTESALLKQKELILQGIEQKLFTLGIFVDFSKAFDRINHRTLLKKLEAYGFRGIFLTLIESYLKYRQQQVIINDKTSSLKHISCGVPQGSILGPLLFNIYINDIINIDDIPKYIIYADDTSLFFTSKDTTHLIGLANSVLDKLSTWSKVNALAINTSKTKAVLFRAKNRIINVTDSLRIGNSSIEIVSTVKSLGVTFHEHMTWNDHVEKVTNKVSHVVGILRRLRTFLPTKIKLMLYNALFLSQISYCHLIWGNTTISNINKLLLLQKKAVRAISNAPLNAHTEPLFTKLGILKVGYIYNHILLKRYHAGQKKKANFIAQLSNLTPNNSSYHTRHKEHWKIPRARTNYGVQMLAHALPSLLNSLDL